MPLPRFHLHDQGVDVWLAPTLAQGDGWVATMQHLARENRMSVVGVNPVLHVDQIPADFPHREQLVPTRFTDQWGALDRGGEHGDRRPQRCAARRAGARGRGDPGAELDLTEVANSRRFMDPTGHYNRPDVFQLHVDTTSRLATTTTTRATA
jgi:nitrilase